MNSSGMITNIDGDSFIFEFEYYPDSVSYPRQVDYSVVKTPGIPLPDVNYSGGNGFENSFTLFLDGLEGGDQTYVENQILFLEGLTYPVQSAGSGMKDQQFKKPPKLKVILDGRIFPCVMKSIETTPLYNFRSGKIARAEVKCTFLEIYVQGLSDDLYNKRLSARKKGTTLRVGVINTNQLSTHNYTSNIIGGAGVFSRR